MPGSREVTGYSAPHRPSSSVLRPHASPSPGPSGNSTAEQDTTPSCSASPPRQPGPRQPARRSWYPARGYALDYTRRMRPTQSGPACAHGRPRAVCRRPGPRPSRRRILAGQRRNIPGVYLWRTQVGPGGCLCRERGCPARSAPCTAQARLAETPSWPCSSSCQRG